MEHLPLNSAPKPLQPEVDPAAPHGRIDVADLITDARRLVGDAGSQVLSREWKRLYERINEPHFSVVVVGEFSRGKSTLINRMLGVEILPVGSIPTTAMLTRVLYAPEPSLAGVRPDGGRERLDAAPESWQPLLAGAEAPRWDMLQCGAPNDWLRASGIQLFDTPGAGDLEPARMEQVIDAISVADATLIAIDARMALSLTERAFIEQHVLGRQVPHIVAVLTHLDAIQPASRAAVLRHVRERLNTLHPQIVFASAHDRSVLPADVEVEIAGPEAITSVLSVWAAEPEHRERVRRQLLANLRRFLALAGSELSTRQAAAEMELEEKHRELEAERFRFDHSRLDWEDLRLALHERCEAAVEWMEGQLAAAETAIGEKLEHGLRRASDPGQWWQQDLPYRLRKELAAVATATGEPLHQRVLADLGWLAHEVDTRFGRNLGDLRIDPFTGFEGEPATASNVGPVRDLNLVRIITRIGAGAATLLGYWLYGPMGMAASVGAGLVGEYVITRHADEQRTSLARALHPIIQRSLRHGATTVRRRLGDAYETLFAETRRAEELWSAARREALESAVPVGQGGEERLAASLDLLKKLESQVNNEIEEG